VDTKVFFSKLNVHFLQEIMNEISDILQHEYSSTRALSGDLVKSAALRHVTKRESECRIQFSIAVSQHSSQYMPCPRITTHMMPLQLICLHPADQFSFSYYFHQNPVRSHVVINTAQNPTKCTGHSTSSTLLNVRLEMRS
jgi:hypothetical protein